MFSLYTRCDTRDKRESTGSQEYPQKLSKADLTAIYIWVLAQAAEDTKLAISITSSRARNTFFKTLPGTSALKFFNSLSQNYTIPVVIKSTFDVLENKAFYKEVFKAITKSQSTNAARNMLMDIETFKSMMLPENIDYYITPLIKYLSLSDEQQKDILSKFIHSTEFELLCNKLIPAIQFKDKSIYNYFESDKFKEIFLEISSEIVKEIKKRASALNIKPGQYLDKFLTDVNTYLQQNQKILKRKYQGSTT